MRISKRSSNKAALATTNMMSIRTLSAAFAAVALSIATVAGGAETWPTRPIKVISPFRHRGAHCVRSGIAADRPAVGHRKSARRRRYARRRVGCQERSERLHAPAQLRLAKFAGHLSQDAAVRRHSRFRTSKLDRYPADCGRGITLTRLQDVGRSGCSGKAKPGTLTFASAGVGSASHMAAERLRVAAAIDVRHIPFRGAEGLNEVMAGRVDFYCIPVAPAVPLINAGKVTVLAVSTRKRAALLPNVPTVAEAGYPDAEYLYWGGVAAPAKTPTTIVHKLHDEIEKALQLPAVRETLATLGVEEQLLTVEQFDKFVSDDMAATLSLAKSAHLEPED